MRADTSDCSGCSREVLDCQPLIAVLEGTKEEFDCWHPVGTILVIGERGE